jgi:ribosomally synthesized peptide (two-chain TOMM family)
MGFDNRLPDYESFLEFEEVYLRAIALSWKDAEFKKRLLEDAAKALANYFNYKCPWSVDLSVREVSPERYGWKKSAKKQYAWDLPQNTFYYGLPPKPENIDPDEEPIALAAYNDSGPTYLFTCC